MTAVNLRPVTELTPQVEHILDHVLAQLRALLADAELFHIGATALPGAVTKGDVDVLVRVSPTRFSFAVSALRQHFIVKQAENWTAEFASFGDDISHELPLGIQLVVKDSREDFLLFLHNFLQSNREALEEYNRLKLKYAPEGVRAYWEAKNAFFARLLASREGDSAKQDG